MIVKAYAIHDDRVKAYHAPFYSPTHGDAERQFVKLVNDEKSTLNEFPEDFDLFHVGEYDTNTGKFLPLDKPSHVVKALQMLKKPRPV